MKNGQTKHDRTKQRKREIMNAAAQGIRRFIGSTRGTSLLGATCSIKFALDDDHGVTVIRVICAGQTLRITIKEE